MRIFLPGEIDNLLQTNKKNPINHHHRVVYIYVLHQFITGPGRGGPGWGWSQAGVPNTRLQAGSPAGIRSPTGLQLMSWPGLNGNAFYLNIQTLNIYWKHALVLWWRFSEEWFASKLLYWCNVRRALSIIYIYIYIYVYIYNYNIRTVTRCSNKPSSSGTDSSRFKRSWCGSISLGREDWIWHVTERKGKRQGTVSTGVHLLDYSWCPDLSS